MPTSTQFSELGFEVPVGEIDAELKKLWEADQASTNASLMNLAVYAEDREALFRNSELVGELTREHACRAILIARDESASETQTRAWITAHCHLAHGKKSVCCEQISFLMCGEARGRLRNTVFAHLASDLPLVFWWQGELSDLFEAALYRMIDRFIFDSTEWSDAATGFRRIEEASKDPRHRVVWQDLAWTRSWHFRLALAGLFDDPMAHRALPEIEEVRIAAAREQRTTALQLLGWLATQAGWKLGAKTGEGGGGSGTKSAHYRFEGVDGKELQATIDWTDGSVPLSLLEVRAPDCEISVSRAPEASVLQHRLRCPGRELASSGPADALDPAGLVAEQLSRGGKNALFQKVWPMFFQLLGAETEPAESG